MSNASATVDLSSGEHIRIDGAVASDALGMSVSAAGDLNGDGVDDVLVGAPYGDTAYVLFGGETVFGDTVDLASLSSARGFRLSDSSSDLSGWSVTAGGDINDDGVDDLVIGSPYADNNSLTNAGSVYVVFGSSGLSGDIDLTSLSSSEGFRIDGAVAGDLAGRSLATGDVSGDGVSDVVIGAPYADNNSRSSSGSVFVVYGGSGTGDLDLASLTTRQGFQVDGAAASDYTGWSVSSGDVNDDDTDDVIIGAPYADNNSRSSSGSVYVVYGRANHLDTDLAVLSRARGFRVDGSASGDRAGHAVSVTADLNDDAKGDLLIGAPYADNAAGVSAGIAYAVYSGTGGTDLASLGLSGFKIVGENENDALGTSVATGGDLNGDGEGELLVGAPGAGTASGMGAAYVVYGRTSTVAGSLSDLEGLEINGVTANDSAGTAIASAGDFDGDGIDDLLVGSPYADNNSRSASGSAYVVQGEEAAYVVDLGWSSGSYGFRIDGADSTDDAGESVATGDINSDGIGDVIVGSPSANNNSRSNSGSVSVVYGEDGLKNIDLASLSTARGLRIDGAAESDSVGYAAASGDVNGDGTDDVIVGAIGTGSYSGSVYVVYGGGSGDVDLASLSSSEGFRIDGAAVGDRAGWSIASGDLNGDGVDDVIVGARDADNNSRTSSGSAYVVYGGGSGDVDLASLSSSEGFRIDGAASGDATACSVARGDVNDDGLDDVVVGAWGADNNGSVSGSVYVVYGGGSGDVDLASLSSSEGFRIDGAAEDEAGWSVAAGDVDGDGSDDVVVGARTASNNTRTYSGSVYVVYGGRSGGVDLASLGSDGFRIDGADADDYVGESLSTSDINGDGNDDVLLGVPSDSSSRRRSSGSVYVIYGGSGGNLDLASLMGSQGFNLYGADVADNTGAATAGGDVNGDGRADVIAGAPYTDNNSRSTSGSAYVVYG